MPAGTADPLAPLLDLPGVREALDAARESVDRLLSHRVLRRQSAAVSSESALRGARASAALDGVDVALGDLRSGAVEDPRVQGALRVSAGLGALAGTWEQAPLQALARLHVLAAAGTVPADRLGRPVGTPDVAARLTALASLVTGGTAVPGTLLAAVVHGELASLAPFGGADGVDGPAGVDGVVARAAARLTLVTRGVDPKSVSVPEVGHLELGAGYRDAFEAYRSGTPEGVASWLVHCATAVRLGAQEGLAICEATLRG